MDHCLKSALSVEQLKVSYVQNKKQLSVLDGISFALEKGEILALLGEAAQGNPLVENHSWAYYHRLQK